MMRLVGFGDLDLIIKVAVGCKVPNLSQNLIAIFPNCFTTKLTSYTCLEDEGGGGATFSSENTV